MNVEENRLNTFQNWPTSAEVEPIRIAKAGFFYTGQGLEVQCFSCGGKISEWNYGDQVMVRHRRLDPNCPFVVNPQISGNIPLILNLQCPNINDGFSSSSGSQAFIDNSMQNQNNGDYGLTEEDEMYKNDALRLLSFIHWPVSFISHESLVRAGFYYIGEERVRCAWCGGELAGGWRPGDVPLEEHRRHFPRCTHAAALAVPPPPPSPPQTPVLNTPPNFSSSSTHEYFSSETPPSMEERPNQQTEGATHNTQVLLSQNTWRTLGVVGGAEGGRHPSRASHASRLATFTGWPSKLTQKPHDLADAGFFYTGVCDQVRCFYCDGGLGKWEVGDEPWTEHARWFPLCGYVLLVKGKDFVESCRVNKVQRTVSADTGLSSRRWNSENNNFPVTESQIEDQMESGPALAALGAGLDAARVRRAIRRRLRTTGVPYTSSEALIDAVLDEQLLEEPWSASPSTNDLAKHFMRNTLRAFAPMLESNVSSSTDTPEQPVSPINSSTVNTMNAVSSNREIRDMPAEHKNKKSHAKPTSTVSSPSSNKSSVSLEEENRQLKEARLCKVCMDSDVNVVFLPCGHLVSCAKCGASLAACPLCRAPVRALVRAYLA